MCGEALVFVIVGNSTGINDTQENNFEPNIYPNPSKDYLNIEVNELVHGVIYSLTGRTVVQFTGVGHFKVSTKDIENGCYSVRIVSKNKTYLSKIIIQK